MWQFCEEEEGERGLRKGRRRRRGLRTTLPKAERDYLYTEHGLLLPRGQLKALWQPWDVGVFAKNCII